MMSPASAFYLYFGGIHTNVANVFCLRMAKMYDTGIKVEGVKFGGAGGRELKLSLKRLFANAI